MKGSHKVSPKPSLIIFCLFLLLMLRESYLFFRKQMSDTCSDWFVDVASKHLRTFKMSLMSPNKSCAKRSNECSAMHLQVHMQQGKGRKTRNTCLLVGAAVKDRKGKSSCYASHHPYPELLLQQSSPEAHQKLHQEHIKRWSKQAEPCNMAAGSSARLHPGRPWAQGPCRRHTLHRGSTSPASLQLKGLWTTARTGEKGHAWIPKPGED